MLLPVRAWRESVLDTFHLSVCLSTVDRRTRERFLESSSQIQSLAEKFRIEGSRYRKMASGAISDVTPPPPSEYKLPLTGNYYETSHLRVETTPWKVEYIEIS